MKLDEDAIIDRLRRNLPGLQAVYLFGSVASGDAGPESDVDLAVLDDSPLDPLALWDLAGEIADLVDRPADLADLRKASTVLQHEVITRGRRLFSRDAATDLYETFILSEKTALDERNEGLLRDILREGRVHGR